MNDVTDCIKKSSDELRKALHQVTVTRLSHYYPSILQMSRSYDRRKSFIALDNTLSSLKPALLVDQYKENTSFNSQCDLSKNTVNKG